ncbi:MAG: TA system VapC family ribonuclease toxin [Acidimicrobiales bacterium]
MNLCDSNVWLSLTLSAHVHHRAARSWLDKIDEPFSALFCRATQQSLLRLLTTAAVLAPYGNPPLTNREAWRIYQAFAADDRIGLVDEEPAGVEQVWVELASAASASPKLWMDAYLAAFARSAGYTLVTTDAAFTQFSDLDLRLLAT